MARFLYCESQEGGMDSFEFGDNGPNILRGWMDDYCKEQDGVLLDWMVTAKVGEYTDHRMGVAIRLVDSGGDEHGR